MQSMAACAVDAVAATPPAAGSGFTAAHGEDAEYKRVLIDLFDIDVDWSRVLREPKDGSGVVMAGCLFVEILLLFVICLLV
jgi:hypothetical protein